MNREKNQDWKKIIVIFIYGDCNSLKSPNEGATHYELVQFVIVSSLQRLKQKRQRQRKTNNARVERTPIRANNFSGPICAGDAIYLGQSHGRQPAAPGSLGLAGQAEEVRGVVVRVGPRRSQAETPVRGRPELILRVQRRVDVAIREVDELLQAAHVDDGVEVLQRRELTQSLTRR